LCVIEATSRGKKAVKYGFYRFLYKVGGKQGDQIGGLLTLRFFWKITQGDPILLLLISTEKSSELNSTKYGLGFILGVFSRKNPVTLLESLLFKFPFAE
jgi:hypothetical protein